MLRPSEKENSELSPSVNLTPGRACSAADPSEVERSMSALGDKPHPRRRRFTRRRFLAGALLGAPLGAVADAVWIEPGWIKVRTLRLAEGRPRHRLVHFSDLHHKGDRAYLERIVARINALSPDAVCFTGDLVEDREWLGETLEGLGRIRSPMFGVPGNHDYWSHAPFEEIARCFEATGGAWLLNETREAAGGQITIVGSPCLKDSNVPPKPHPGTRNVLLIHYPAWVKNLAGQAYDLILAGHSHGGQIRIPFYGAVMVPFGVDEYEMGMFRTASGPLYVSPGLGWFSVPLRFNCRPEITVFEL